MTALTVGDLAVLGEPRPRQARRRRGWVAVIGIVAAVLAAWVWVGTHPEVAAGSFSGSGDDFRIVDDGIANTRYVMQGDQGTFLLSIRNEGRVPFTVLGLDGNQSGPFMTIDGFQPDPFADGKAVGDMSLPTQRQVTLGKGEEAGVVLRFTFDPCIYRERGSYLEIQEVRVRVSQAGIHTSQSLPLELPLTIPGTSTPENHPSECPPLE